MWSQPGRTKRNIPPSRAFTRDEILTGKVYLVGAGPGDPGLITVKGMQALKQAQVVVYDRLVDPVLLQAVSESAERIFVGLSLIHI